MEIYVAVDSGKYATKVAVYSPVADEVKTFKFKTRFGPGNFEDDALESNTVIVEYEGNTYKIGNGASTEAALETTKASEIHKICTMAAIAMCVSSNEVDEVHAAIGIPVKEWENVEKRLEYKKYILPDGEVSIKLMAKSDGDIVDKRFKIVSKHVYPESQGALFLKKVAPLSNGTVAVMDLGNLNINCTCWNHRELDRQYSLTDELGGNILISGLSQELSAEFSRCDETYVAKVLKQPLEDRYLKPNRPNPDVESLSKQMINDYLLNHVKMIRRKCDAKHWSLDFMDIVFIGGTSDLLRNEIKEIFGESSYIPKHPEYANVVGFLRVMCAKFMDKVIAVPLVDGDDS